MTELKDTIEGMTSADYKERFKSEYLQTKIRYEKLNNFCNNIEVADLMDEEGPEHDCPLCLLKEQLFTMGHYIGILEKRAIIEGIDL